MINFLTRRAASPSDIGFARATHHAAYRDTVVLQFGSWDEALQDSFFERDWATGGFDILVLEGRPCGYLAVDERPDFLVVRELVIAPQFQGRGFGTQILREIQGKASANSKSIRLQVLHLNPALKLYRRLGFKECGRGETHVSLEWKGKL